MLNATLDAFAVVGLFLAQSTDTPTWVGLVVAVLGSSALGAIFGGYLTTRMRGRIEREEAWRTRLIEAADNLNGVLAKGLMQLGAFLARARSGDVQLRNDDGTLTESTAAQLDALWSLASDASFHLSRLELLFPDHSDAQFEGLQTMRFMQRAIGLLDGRAPAQHLIRAVLAERETEGSGVHELWKLESRYARYVIDFQGLLERASLPDSFDPSDDVNVARWAFELHGMAGQRAHAYSRAARSYIESYRLDR